METAAKLLTRDEARRIAVNMVKLPELLSRRQTWGSAIAFNGDDDGHTDWVHKTRQRRAQRPSIHDVS
jgi:hypothetical protein